jgi:hypothetical protein
MITLEICNGLLEIQEIRRLFSDIIVGKHLLLENSDTTYLLLNPTQQTLLPGFIRMIQAQAVEVQLFEMERKLGPHRVVVILPHQSTLSLHVLVEDRVVNKFPPPLLAEVHWLEAIDIILVYLDQVGFTW